MIVALTGASNAAVALHAISPVNLHSDLLLHETWAALAEGVRRDRRGRESFGLMLRLPLSGSAMRPGCNLEQPDFKRECFCLAARLFPRCGRVNCCARVPAGEACSRHDGRGNTYAAIVETLIPMATRRRTASRMTAASCRPVSRTVLLLTGLQHPIALSCMQRAAGRARDD